MPLRRELQRLVAIQIMKQEECNIAKIIEALISLQKELEKIDTSKKAPVNNNELSKQSEEKTPSWCDWVRGRVKKEASKHASESGGSQGGSEEDAELEIKKLLSDIRQMKAAFENLTQFQIDMRNNLESDLHSTKLKAILTKTNSISSRTDELKEIRRKVFNLKCEIPSLLYKKSSGGLSITDSQIAVESGEIVEDGVNIFLPSLHFSKDFKDSPAFEEIVNKFEKLDIEYQLCLLSFAVFPENREVKGTMLMYWWIGEGFISCDDSENSVMRILDDFSSKGLLEPVEDERKLKSSSYKMDPHVHSAVIHLAASMDVFKLYSSKGILTMEKSSKEKVCLVKGSSLARATKTYVKPKTLETIFNSSERYLDFIAKWFPLMDSLRVLYLGRWEQTAKRHIEVESTKFLKDIKYLKNLRLASFQGISRIEQLEKYICKLSKLVILDLKACYNLERLPEDIGLLVSLVYLDVSECYMIDRMPKGIEDLSKLQVLKGFVISQSDDESNCAVKNLVSLKKLSITVNKYSFKVENLMESLRRLEQLKSLKIAWGACPEDDQKEKKTHKPEKKRETTNEVKENQGGTATEKKHKELNEREDDHEQKKGHASEEKKGDVEEMGKREDGASSKKEDRRNEEADLEEGKKRDEVKAESLKSDKLVEAEKKTSPSQEAIETIQNKPDDKKGENKVQEEGDGDKGKTDLEERNKKYEVEAEKSKSGNVVEGEKKATTPGESSDMIQKKPYDKSKVEMEGDGDNEKTDLDDGKNQDGVEAERSKSDKVVEGEKKATPPGESSDMIQKKPDDKSRVENEGDRHKEKDDLDNGKNQDGVEAERSKSEKVIEGEKKATPHGESSDMIQKKPDDKSRVENEGDGHKEKDDLDDGVEAERSKSEKVVEGEKKASPYGESSDMIQKKPDDKSKVEKERDGYKEKADLDEGKNQDEVEAERSKSEKVLEGEKNSPPEESSDMIQKTPYDKSKVEKEGDGDKEKADLDEENKQDEVEAERSKSEKVVKGDEKSSPPEESKDNQSQLDDKSKVENEGDRDKGKADPEEVKKHGKVETESSKSDNGVEGVKKINPSPKLTDAIQKKPDDQQRGDKQEEKGNEEKDKANLDEGKKKDEVKAESSKSDKVIKGNEKTILSKDSIDTIQSKPDDHREINKVQEKAGGDDLKKLDGIEAKIQKSDKTTKFRKKVSFSENTEALIQKKLDDLKKGDTMAGESHEIPSPPRPPKESGSSKAKLKRKMTQIEMAVGKETKKWLKKSQENHISTSKLPSSLKKLELECFPQNDPPSWLNPENLNNLKKLSIKGGNLSRINPTAENKWPVEILRLKYLHEFKVEWRDLKALFPEMILLEKYECPKIALCPTDGNGVWRSPNMLK